MTLAEALAIAEQAKPKHRQPLDKLQRSAAVAKHVAGVAALAKRFEKLGADVFEMQKRIDQIEAGLMRVEDHLNQPQPALPKGCLQ
jgi:hypothetical protein